MTFTACGKTIQDLSIVKTSNRARIYSCRKASATSTPNMMAILVEWRQEPVGC